MLRTVELGEEHALPSPFQHRVAHTRETVACERHPAVAPGVQTGSGGVCDSENHPKRDSGGLERPSITLHIEDTVMLGEFDDGLLLEAFSAITNEMRSTVSSKEGSTLSLHVHRNAAEALCVWRGGKLHSRYQPFESSNGCGTIHTALAAKIIEAHGGRLKCEADTIRAWLPLTDQG